MTLNFIQGLPSLADQRLVTQPGLLKKVGDRKWIKEVAERGSGVTFAEFISMVRKSLAAFRLQKYVVEVIRPTNNTAKSLAKVQQALATNEATDHDIILAYFNQGVLTGDWDGPHISPIAAYDQEAGQVLIMDVDREWYIPYWAPIPSFFRRCCVRHRPRMGDLRDRRAVSSGSSRRSIAMSKPTPGAGRSFRCTQV